MKTSIAMLHVMAVVPMLAAFAAAAPAPVAQAPVAFDDGEWVEEVVIRRRRVAPKPVAAPAPAATAAPAVIAPPAPAATVAPAVLAVPAVTAAPPAAVEAKKDEPPPPPEPSAGDAAEPRRLVRYFCKCWKDEDYERLWWAMTPQYRKKHPLKKFAKLFDEDKEYNGGIADENIVLDDVELEDGGIQVTVDLRYRFKRVGVKRVKAVVEKKGLAYRMRESGIIPLDMHDL